MTFESLKTLLEADRSYRRFDATKKISDETLRQLVSLTRYCASGRNAQPLKYRLVTRENECSKLFDTLKWAGYYTDWEGPSQEEQPVAYLVQCLDTRFGDSCLCDDGLQLQAITLGATSLGIGGCIIKSFDASKCREILSLASHLSPRYVLALGYPRENVVLEEMDGTMEASFKYFRDENDRHHVPKRPLDELIIG